MRPVALLLPKRLRSSPWSFPFFRATEKLLRGNGLVKSEGADDVLKCASEIRKAEKTLCRSFLFASRWSLLSQLACLAGGNFLFLHLGYLCFPDLVSQEVCRVLGLSQTRKSSSRCPQLWIDEAWPPSRLTPRSKRSAPIWILPATEQNALEAWPHDAFKCPMLDFFSPSLQNRSSR